MIPLKQRPNRRPRHVGLSEPTGPQINVVDSSVEVTQLVLRRHVGCDVRETRHAGQPVRRPNGVVIGNPVVTPTLDIERRQIEPALTGLPKQEVADLIVSFVSTSCAVSDATAFRNGSMSP